MGLSKCSRVSQLSRRLCRLTPGPPSTLLRYSWGHRGRTSSPGGVQVHNQNGLTRAKPRPRPCQAPPTALPAPSVGTACLKATVVESTWTMLTPQPGWLTVAFDEEEGKLLHFLGVRDAHLPAQLFQHLCCHLEVWTGLRWDAGEGTGLRACQGCDGVLGKERGCGGGGCPRTETHGFLCLPGPPAVALHSL